MKLCCGTNLYASFSLEEALEEIKKTGIDYVDLWCCEAICQHANTEKDDVRCGASARRLMGKSMGE